MQMKAVETVFRKSARVSILVVVLLSGCATPGVTQQSCKVLDPDLTQGAYRGGCENGLADSYGEVSGASSYRGDFRAGKKHGKGIKVMQNGDRYAGEFANDYRHGKGIYSWGEHTPWAGDRYEGEYQQDKRHGWGVYSWESGDRYEGPWENDLRMGLSVMETRRVQRSVGGAATPVSGKHVCIDVPLGLNHHQRIRGVVETISEHHMSIRIAEMEGTRASYQGRMVRVGDMVEDNPTNWKLCAD